EASKLSSESNEAFAESLLGMRITSHGTKARTMLEYLSQTANRKLALERQAAHQTEINSVLAIHAKFMGRYLRESRSGRSTRKALFSEGFIRWLRTQADFTWVEARTLSRLILYDPDHLPPDTFGVHVSLKQKQGLIYEYLTPRVRQHVIKGLFTADKLRAQFTKGAAGLIEWIEGGTDSIRTFSQAIESPDSFAKWAESEQLYRPEAVRFMEPACNLAQIANYLKGSQADLTLKMIAAQAGGRYNDIRLILNEARWERLKASGARDDTATAQFLVRKAGSSSSFVHPYWGRLFEVILAAAQNCPDEACRAQVLALGAALMTAMRRQNLFERATLDERWQFLELIAAVVRLHPGESAWQDFYAEALRSAYASLRILSQDEAAAIAQRRSRTRHYRADLRFVSEDRRFDRAAIEAEFADHLRRSSQRQQIYDWIHGWGPQARAWESGVVAYLKHPKFARMIRTIDAPGGVVSVREAIGIAEEALLKVAYQYDELPYAAEVLEPKGTPTHIAKIVTRLAVVIADLKRDIAELIVKIAGPAAAERTLLLGQIFDGPVADLRTNVVRLLEGVGVLSNKDAELARQRKRLMAGIRNRCLELEFALTGLQYYRSLRSDQRPWASSDELRARWRALTVQKCISMFARELEWMLGHRHRDENKKQRRFEKRFELSSALDSAEPGAMRIDEADGSSYRQVPGLVRRIFEASESELLARASILKTLSWMSPERRAILVLRHGLHPDYRGLSLFLNDIAYIIAFRGISQNGATDRRNIFRILSKTQRQFMSVQHIRWRRLLEQAVLDKTALSAELMWFQARTDGEVVLGGIVRLSLGADYGGQTIRAQVMGLDVKRLDERDVRADAVLQERVSREDIRNGTELVTITVALRPGRTTSVFAVSLLRRSTGEWEQLPNTEAVGARLAKTAAKPFTRRVTITHKNGIHMALGMALAGLAMTIATYLPLRVSITRTDRPDQPALLWDDTLHGHAGVLVQMVARNLLMLGLVPGTEIEVRVDGDAAERVKREALNIFCDALEDAAYLASSGFQGFEKYETWIKTLAPSGARLSHRATIPQSIKKSNPWLTFLEDISMSEAPRDLVEKLAAVERLIDRPAWFTQHYDIILTDDDKRQPYYFRTAKDKNKIAAISGYFGRQDPEIILTVEAFRALSVFTLSVLIQHLIWESQRLADEYADDGKYSRGQISWRQMQVCRYPELPPAMKRLVEADLHGEILVDPVERARMMERGRMYYFERKHRSSQSSSRFYNKEEEGRYFADKIKSLKTVNPGVPSE
ncbi:MAG: HPr family phosphocarrier protein, partial [Candidatus Omnitrophota bacterium]